MNSIVYDIFAFCVSLFGIGGGVYLIWRGHKNKYEWFLKILIILLGCSQFFVGVVYLLSLIDVIQVGTNLGVFIRPSLIFLLLLPNLIIHEARI
jgi:hypothetical protein